MTDITPDSAETTRLLHQAGAGDADAFSQLLERHRAALRQSVAQRLDPRMQPRVDPSDVIQETQVEAFRRLDEYLERRPMPLRLWLLKTAHQRLRKVERLHLDAAKRSVEREVPMPDRSSLQLLRGIMSRGSNPSNQARRRELAQRVRRALAQLSENDREIVWLRNNEGLSNAEAACLLEATAAATKKRYARALLRLQRLLLDQGIAGTEI